MACYNPLVIKAGTSNGNKAKMLVLDIGGHMDRITMAGCHCLKREVTRRES
jgi:hypothetical protein